MQLKHMKLRYFDKCLDKKLSVHAFFARTCSEGLSFSQEHNKANDKQFGF